MRGLALRLLGGAALMREAVRPSPISRRSFLGFGSGLGWGWVLRTASASISRSSVLVFPGVGFHGLKYMGRHIFLEVGNRYRAQSTPKIAGNLMNVLQSRTARSFRNQAASFLLGDASACASSKRSIWRYTHYIVLWANRIGARVTELTKDGLKVARLERQRLAAEDGAKALEEVAKKAADVRMNMARLRELRLAKEAQEVQTEILANSRTAKAKPQK